MGQVLNGSTVYTDNWKSYDGLVLDGDKHFRIHHHENQFARDKNHVNGFESKLGTHFGWFRKADSVAVMDAKPDNFILSPEGIVPIDLQMAYVDLP